MKYFDADLVRKNLPMRECITLMEYTLKELSRSKQIEKPTVQNPLRQALRIPFLTEKIGLLGSMPSMCANYQGRSYVANKVITVYPGNKQHGKHSHQGVVVLFDAEFGELVSISDAVEITAIRTAAVSALAAQTFKREKKNLIICIMGTGEQAIRHAEAFITVFGQQLTIIQLWGRNERSCMTCKQYIEELIKKKPMDVQIKVQLDAKLAVQSSDIICTVTSSQEPILKGDWLLSGQTVIAVGACTPKARELDTEAITKSKIFYDCEESFLNECGEYLQAVHERSATEIDLVGELGDVLLGNVQGRVDDEMIVFKSLGVGLEDLMSAAFLLQNYNHEF
jgi:alanine dehydrogenase